MRRETVMKLFGLFVATALVGALAMLGCGDSNSGGGSPQEICNTGDCVDNAAQREACEIACAATPGDCSRLAQDLCF